MLMVLGGIILALLVLARVLAARGGRRLLASRGNVVEVVEVTRLEPRKSIYVIKVAGKFFLIGTTESGIQVLAGGPLDQEAVEAALGAKAGADRPRAGGPARNRTFLEMLTKPGQASGRP